MFGCNAKSTKYAPRTSATRWLFLASIIVTTQAAWADTINFETAGPNGTDGPLSAGDMLGPGAGGPQPYADDGIIFLFDPDGRGAAGPLMIFDSANPTGNDDDLGSPNETCNPPGPGVGEGGEVGEPGENCTPLGNLLIISTDGNAGDPNDHATGGVIRIEFDPTVFEVGVTIENVSLLDVEGNAGEIRTYDASGNPLGTQAIRVSDQKVPVLGTGNNAFDTTTVNQSGVFAMEVDTTTSAALAAIHYDPQQASLVIKKDTNPETSGVPFDFSGPESGDTFQLNDDGQQSFTLVPGTYTVAETIPAGWDLTAINCQGSGDSQVTLGNGSVEVTLDDDESLTCTFTNTQEKGQIIVQKQTLPDGATQPFAFDGPDGASYNLTDGQEAVFDLFPGPYSVSETVPVGWVLQSAVCSGDDDGSDPADIQLDSNETVTCVFTNNFQQGTIIVRKETIPDGVGQAFGFTGDLGSFSLSDGGSQSFNVSPGIYSVGETIPAGWDLTSTTCSDQSPVSAISLQDGETVTCTFTNTQQGQIKVTKQTIPDGSSQSFDFTSDYSNPFSLTDGQTNTSGFLAPGTYSVSESVPPGWELTPATCSDGSDPGTIDLGAGEVVECTFTNTQDGTITIVKQTEPDGATQSFDFTGDLGAFSLTDGQSESQSFQPGTYSVAETEPAGWELTSATCSDGSDPGTIDLAAGENVTCTFTNTQDGTITIVKQTQPENTGQIFDFTGDLGDFSLVDNGTADFNRQPGTYGVTESVPFGWEQTSATCTDQSDPSSIELAAGEEVTCTFTNTKLEAAINIVKATNGQESNPGTCTGIPVDEAVSWTYAVTNPGELPLQIDSITDDAGTPGDTGDDFTPAFDGGDANSNGLLDVGETWTYSASGTALDQDPYTNTVTVNGTASDGTTVLSSETATDSDESCYNGLTPGLTIEKTDGGITVPEGSSFAYTLSYENTGQLDLTGVTISDTVPANTTFDAAGSTTGWSCADNAPAGTVCTFTVGNLAKAATGSVQFGLTVDELLEPDPVTGQCPTPPQNPQVDNTASIEDDDGHGDSDSDTTPITTSCNEVDIAIEKSDGGQAFVPEGGTVVYTLSYENLGDVDVTGVVITETVPTNTTFNASASTAGWSCAAGAAAGTACTFNVGALAAGASGSVLFGLTVDELVEPDPDTGECPDDPPQFQVDNTGTIADDGANGVDADPSNNSASDETPITISCEEEQRAASISIVKDPQTQLLQPGESAQFTITVTNDGEVDLVNVVVSDQQAPDCNRNIGDLAVDAVVVYNCSRDNVTQGFTNVATVTGETPDGGDVSDEDDADVSVLTLEEPEQAVPIPTLTQWGLIFMASLLLLLGASGIRFRKRSD